MYSLKKDNNMKRHYLVEQGIKQFLVIVMLFFTAISFGQETNNETYRFVNSNTVNNVNDYVVALSTADMTIFRYANKSSTIEFESGLKVELYSANHIVSIGKVVDISKVLTSDPINKGYYIFGLSSDKKTIIQKFTNTKLK